MASASLMLSLVQLIATDAMRGRVMSVYNLAFRAGIPLGSLVLGKLIPIFGVSTRSRGRDSCWWPYPLFPAGQRQYQRDWLKIRCQLYLSQRSISGSVGAFAIHQDADTIDARGEPAIP